MIVDRLTGTASRMPGKPSLADPGGRSDPAPHLRIEYGAAPSDVQLLAGGGNSASEVPSTVDVTQHYRPHLLTALNDWPPAHREEGEIDLY